MDTSIGELRMATDLGVFGPDRLDDLDAWFRANGFVILRGLLSAVEVDALEAECARAQVDLVAGRLPGRFGTSILIEGDAGEKATRFANYVTHITELSPTARAAASHPLVVGLMQRWLGAGCWLMDDVRFGVVYQDARPGRESSYTRIGWHSDWQSGPHLRIFPSVAFTFHIDATSPDNGFLRVVPGSHRWATPAPYDNINGIPVPEGADPAGGWGDEAPPVPMPLAFGKVPGEVAVYTERGDVIFHDSYLWHSAARATDDGARRRHVRGAYHTGEHLSEDGFETFVKNAAR